MSYFEYALCSTTFFNIYTLKEKITITDDKEQEKKKKIRDQIVVKRRTVRLVRKGEKLYGPNVYVDKMKELVESFTC